MIAGELLESWCDGLWKLQVRGYGAPHDGGFLCPACSVIHGRADHAFYPFLTLFQRTGDARWMEAAQAVFRWHGRVLRPDGSVTNGLNCPWKGITVFSALGYAKALRHCGDTMDPDLRKRVEDRLRAEAAWVYSNLRVPPKLRENIDCPAAAAAVFAMAGTLFGNDAYVAEARRSFDYCLSHASGNGLSAGEGGAPAAVTPRGCRPIDLGYNIEETIPCLAEAAAAIGDANRVRRAAAVLRAQLEFLLPDGAIDNSFGMRSIQWTYYGGRTSEGCLGALTLLRDHDPVFREAARRHFALLAACSHDGMLYGGRRYRKLGIPPCSHHSLCHAVALADALHHGFDTPAMDSRDLPLPCEEPPVHCRHYPELDTFKVAVGPFQATVTAYDVSSADFRAGLSHASGGTLTLLHHRDLGPLVVGSTAAYALVEPLDMQPPVANLPHASLLPRIEMRVGGKPYSSSLETDVTMESSVSGHCVTVSVHAMKYDIAYTFGERTVGMDVSLHAGPSAQDPVFVLPLVSGTCSPDTRNAATARETYWLPGGFKATEYTLRPNANGRFSITLRPK